MAVETPTSQLIEAGTLLDVAARNYRTLHRQIHDLTHEDSLLQLPFRGNCLNWVVGHITQSRNKMLRLVGMPMVWTPEQIARYDRESPPITSDEDAFHFNQIVADLAVVHERLTEKLQRMTPEDLNAPADSTIIAGIPPWSVAEFLHFLLWHETYHIGQTELLRQLAGKNDKVI